MRKYRFVESEKSEGQTTRTGGSTRRSLAAMKHLSKVGEVKYVKGYTYNGRYNTTHVGVLVVGTKGSVRFGGFSWGYAGEGCRGLQVLFDRLKIPAHATTIGVWPEFSKVGDHWKLYLVKGVWYTDTRLRM